jgi:hypothetical protein
MGTRQSGRFLVTSAEEIAITEAAITTFWQLLGAARDRVTTHAYRDGGLICEDRTSRARPRMFRIAADGALLPDNSYNFARGAFVRAPAPGQAVAG